MGKRQYVLVVVLAVIAGWVGGLLSGDRYILRSVLSAETPPNVVTAQEFRVVDENGVTLAALAADDGIPHLTFVSPAGRPILSLGPHMLAASIEGAVLYGTDAGREPERRRITLSEIQQEKHR